MNELRINAHAKINLTLDVTGVRENGYHDVSMVMQSIALHDVLTVKKRNDNEVRLSFSDTEIIKGMKLSAGDDNLICKAFRKFWEYVSQKAGEDEASAVRFEEILATPHGVDVILTKNIPSEAGMGGGSADGAAIIKALNKLFECGLTNDELCEIGVKIGADVPFCVLNGTVLAEGIGEILTVLPKAPQLSVLLVKPGVGASTKEIYDRLVLDENTQHPDTIGMIKALKAGDAKVICGKLCNVLEPVTVSLLPVIGEIKQEMLDLGASGALMSGSGSTVFGIFTDTEKLKTAEEYFNNKGDLYTAVTELLQ